jgi:hypothetical protein
MGLRATAEADMRAILSDSENGFGWPIVLIDPTGTEVPLVGFSTDISQVIDHDTGAVVSGRSASVALSMVDITMAEMTLPRGVSESNERPWKVRFSDIQGQSYLFKVEQSNPDRAIGMITLLLGAYS